ncbi:MAG TPA: pantoate--beta-alanine ligase [Alphaproteobacteria bacterium]|nr:pantoate--beta-alanine ligase [Alphaproteobacteria bacterium]
MDAAAPLAGPLVIARNANDLRGCVTAWRRAGLRVGVVPTMGALHEGHLTLARRAIADCDHVIVTLFVNPMQFGPNEDYTRYPRDEAADAAKLAALGVDLLYAPDVSAMYRDGFATTVTVANLTDGMEGAIRPGHFAGVATVVTKLLNQAQADDAYFGEKDYQQLCVIRRLAADLDIPTRIHGVPTVREADGLALSSRNAYLTPAQRKVAPALQRELQAAAAALKGGGDIAKTLDAAKAAILKAGFDAVDYVELRDTASLAPLTALKGPGLGGEARLLAAARLGATRLLDNLSV